MLLALLMPAFAEPSFDVARGVHEASFPVTITPSDGGSVFYSLDTSRPTVPYTTPLVIDRTTVVRAVEIAADGTPSAIVTATYVFVDDVLQSSVMDPNIVNHTTYGPVVAASLRELPIISLVAPAGIALTEGPVSLEWIHPEGDEVHVNAGAYVSGGTSWQYPKTSFRLVFRSEYGPGRLEADLYGPDVTGVPAADEHDALSLRSGNHDTIFYLGAQGQHLRNFWMDESQLEMGHIVPHGRFAHLYLNGVYHGLYHVRERFNAAMMSEYLGGDEDDYEAVTAGNVFDGDGSAWAATVAASGEYQAAKEWLNVPDFLDYMVLNFYAGNAWDWYYWHNWAAAGPDTAGRGGFRFHSSDSDICLYYDWTVNILSLGGPSNVFANLMAEGDPDFQVALADAIHRNLTGPLSAENAADRYARLAGLAEGGIVAESARWGDGWWDRDGEWAVERDRLLYGWFPFRTDELYRQFREAGWYPLDAPVFDAEAGLVEPGATLTVAVPDDSLAELWVTLDGHDPREPGGATAPSALGPDGARVVALDRSTVVRARLKDGDTWGPLAEGFYEVDAPADVVLNEWNAVSADKWLGGEESDGADTTLGRVMGNGGDWIELLVRIDTDLRGWRLTMTDRNGDAGALVFTDDPLLADVRAGTLLTIAEDLPEDPAYAPDSGDWRFHLRAGARGSGRYVSATPFDVTSRDWQLTLQDAEGRVRFGPVGEGVEPYEGISSEEVGALTTTPNAGTRRDSGAYDGERDSTFGAPNVWADGEQDLSGLRGENGGVVEIGDTARVDTGDLDTASPEPGAGERGCGSGVAPGLSLALAAAALVRRRRDPSPRIPRSRR